jgi:tetratricopeptide (TPR) repeat protein
LSSAITSYERSITLDPGYFTAYYNLGLAAVEADQLPKALTAFETALAIDNRSLDARFNFGLTLQKAGFPIDAVRELETVAAARPDETRAHLALANLYAQDLGDRQRAREHYSKVLTLEPRHPQAAGIRSWLTAHR